jgi:superfamily II DNA or RNA helicase
MSIVVPWNQLTERQQANLATDLVFTPRNDYQPRRYFRQSYSSPEVQPVSFYFYHNDCVYLPFRYALRNGFPVPTHPSVFMLFTGELRDYQYEVCARIYQLLMTHRTAIIGLYPGFGKTVVGAYLTCQLGLPTLVLIHLDVLIEQHVNTFLKYTSVTIMIVGKVGHKLRKLMLTYPLRFPPLSQAMPDVIICMEQRVKDIPGELLSRVGCLIIDEAHCFYVPSRVYPILACQPQYVILQTATLERDDEMHEMLEPLVGTEGVFLESNKHVQCLIINTGFRPPVDPDKDVDYHKLMTATYTNPERIAMIGHFIQSNPGFRILILTKLVDRCEYLANIIGTITSEVDYVHGKKRDFVPRDILVGTIQKVGTAFIRY